MEELVKMVAEMRRLQREYFKNRNSLLLAQCKKAEKQVDALIIMHTTKNKPTEERTLF